MVQSKSIRNPLYNPLNFANHLILSTITSNQPIHSIASQLKRLSHVLIFSYIIPPICRLKYPYSCFFFPFFFLVFVVFLFGLIYIYIYIYPVSVQFDFHLILIFIFIILLFIFYFYFYFLILIFYFLIPLFYLLNTNCNSTFATLRRERSI